MIYKYTETFTIYLFPETPSASGEFTNSNQQIPRSMNISWDCYYCDFKFSSCSLKKCTTLTFVLLFIKFLICCAEGHFLCLIFNFIYKSNKHNHRKHEVAEWDILYQCILELHLNTYYTLRAIAQMDWDWEEDWEDILKKMTSYF